MHKSTVNDQNQMRMYMTIYKLWQNNGTYRCSIVKNMIAINVNNSYVVVENFGVNTGFLIDVLLV